jgi:DNA-binding response OmpR family regulator
MVEITMDGKRAEVKIGDTELHLCPKEYGILEMLIRYQGVVVTREAIMRKVWDLPKAVKLKTRTVDQYVARMRRKMRAVNPAAAKAIRTVCNRGYRFVA